jgi:hypothetical protein
LKFYASKLYEMCKVALHGKVWWFNWKRFIVHTLLPYQKYKMGYHSSTCGIGNCIVWVHIYYV